MKATHGAGVIGICVGLGFGIFAATKNFNTTHQSEDMSEEIKMLSEFLQQTGNAFIQASVVGFLSSCLGSIIDVAIFTLTPTQPQPNENTTLSGLRSVV